ncbi:uncharacterized protein LOC128961410 isoform X2 [Oppia nitens]|uniref:uncharacterized protein LOC128961410 isoform X2 n=1 Tax=Oppia nitens TaxID=1686743 RepID=UPI0023DB3266|nr:uncharacterized protein LOC128961410 isoform X2 [Oppia nitens]
MHFTLNIGTVMFAALVFSSQFNGHHQQSVPEIPGFYSTGIQLPGDTMINTTTMAGEGNSVETDTNNNNTAISTANPDDQQPPVGNSTADSDINSTTPEPGSDTTTIHTGADTTGVTSNENTQQSQTQAPSVSSGVITTSAKPKSMSSGMTWILIAVIVVGVIALILVLCLCVMKNRDSSDHKKLSKSQPTSVRTMPNKVGSVKSGPQSPPNKLGGPPAPPPPPPPPPPPEKVSKSESEAKSDGQPVAGQVSTEQTQKSEPIADPTVDDTTTTTSDESLINIDAEPIAVKSNGPEVV